MFLNIKKKKSVTGRQSLFLCCRPGVGRGWRSWVGTTPRLLEGFDVGLDGFPSICTYLILTLFPVSPASSLHIVLR